MKELSISPHKKEKIEKILAEVERLLKRVKKELEEGVKENSGF